VPVDEEKRATLRKVAAVGAGSPLLGLSEDDRSDTREALESYVEATPGAHFSKVRDDLDLATGETQYHLGRLVDADVLVVTRDGDYKRYFPADRFDEFERTALGYLRRETPREMLLALLERPDRPGTELADQLSVSAATISTSASEMERAGLLDRSEGCRVRRPETVLSLLLRYGHSIEGETRQFASDAAALFNYDPS
jgi:predicted transcriptional regulator